MTSRAESIISDVMTSDAYRGAVATLAAEHDRTVEDIIALTQIEAPSFQEATRAQAFRNMAEAHGLKDLEIDAERNVTGMRPGAGNGPIICIAAHLDTVFPAGTDLTVRREGTKLFAPGVGDDTRSLAVLLAWLRAMDAAGVRTRADLLFVADVGEEGPGDLRGMRHLFQKGRYKDRISAFITVDSPDMDRIAVGGVGSKRYRVTFKGPRRTQLRRVRPGEPDVRHGRCDRAARAHHGAQQSEDHVQCERHWRRHVDQLDPQQRVDRLRPALGRTG